MIGDLPQSQQLYDSVWTNQDVAGPLRSARVRLPATVSYNDKRSTCALRSHCLCVTTHTQLWCSVGQSNSLDDDGSTIHTPTTIAFDVTESGRHPESIQVGLYAASSAGARLAAQHANQNHMKWSFGMDTELIHSVSLRLQPLLNCRPFDTS